MLLEDRRHNTTSYENLPLSRVGKHGEKGIFLNREEEGEGSEICLQKQELGLGFWEQMNYHCHH